MRVGKAKVTVILNFFENGSELRFKATDYKFRDLPKWMNSQREDLIEVQMVDSRCYDEIGQQLTLLGRMLPRCVAFFEYEEADRIDIVYADIQEYYPTSLILLGRARKASKEEIARYQIIPPGEIERMELEEQQRKKLQENPDLERFSNIDLED